MSKKKFNKGGIVYSTNPEAMHEDEPESAREFLPVEKQNLMVRLDKKHRAGKVVTLVSGFDADKKSIEDIGKSIKKFCGTGGTVEADAVLIQGDAREKVLQWLKKNGYKNIRVV